MLLPQPAVDTWVSPDIKLYENSSGNKRPPLPALWPVAVQFPGVWDYKGCSEAVEQKGSRGRKQRGGGEDTQGEQSNACCWYRQGWIRDVSQRSTRVKTGVQQQGSAERWQA